MLQLNKKKQPLGQLRCKLLKAKLDEAFQFQIEGLGFALRINPIPVVDKFRRLGRLCCKKQGR